MAGPISIGSTAEWDTLLSGTSVVIADFYADWCGPCKMIAPHYEKLAKEHSRPKKVAFAKVNVDSQSTISRTNGVSAMPTFKIFHNGSCVETIKGANPSALSEAILKAIKLADGAAPGTVFKTPGRTLGGEGQASQGTFDVGNIVKILVMMLGLYLVSLFSFDSYKAAETSMFNPNKPKAPRTSAGAAKGPGGPAAAKQAAQKPAFRTLADLGSE